MQRIRPSWLAAYSSVGLFFFANRPDHSKTNSCPAETIVLITMHLLGMFPNPCHMSCVSFCNETSHHFRVLSLCQSIRANYFPYIIAFNPHNSFANKAHYLRFTDDAIGEERLKICLWVQSLCVISGFEFKSVWLLTMTLNSFSTHQDSALCSGSKLKVNEVSISEDLNLAFLLL